MKIRAADIKNAVEKEESITNYINSLDKLINKPAKAVEKKNAVILIGGAMDTSIPVEILQKSSASILISIIKVLLQFQ